MDGLSKTFSPKEVENKWYLEWIENGCFDRKIDTDKASYCILMPPPNVTGVLHMGHLLNNTLQDLLIRYAKHNGKSAVWVPGTDHAGISMQVRVEKELEKKGISRKTIGRKKFLEYAYQWRDEHGEVIFTQLQKLGVSCDWKNKKHTLDDDYSFGVLSAFVELYKRGYIYRGQRMINWCPVSLTALSDEEVKMVPQTGKLYYIKYYYIDQPDRYIEVATTRPETIMGDVAVAVNPSDERYKEIIGKYVRRPLFERALPVIADDAVLKEFGTGALKITPAHDKVDFEIGKRHNLEIIDVLNPNGTLNEHAGKYCGLDRFDAREKIAQELSERGLLSKEEEYTNNVGFSERGNVPIEPRLSEQWFLRYPKTEEAKQAVERGMIKLYPKRWEKIYLHWLNNIQDWCISRQLWWGHQIPVWYKKGADRMDPKNWFVSVTGPNDPENWEQEEDVLDTWFSSWLWPFVTFGWPDGAAMDRLGFKYFFPTDTLITGPDIIFFWVTRMIIASLELVGERRDRLTPEEIEQRIPFRNVYFTSIIRDSIGRKMSKSLGNSPEPLTLIDKYGADGVRLGLLLSAPYGQDVLFDENRIALGRNFCTKLWNAARFRLLNKLNYDKNSLENIVQNITELQPEDHAIILQLIQSKHKLDEHMLKYEITSAVQTIYNFFWNDYCDWYVEATKQRLQRQDSNTIFVHDILLRQILLMLNPFIPFITEELWHACGFGNDGEFIQYVVCDSPEQLEKIFQNLHLDYSQLEYVTKKREFIENCRTIIAKNRHNSTKNVQLFVQPNQNYNFLEDAGFICKLLSIDSLKITNEDLDLPAMVSNFGTIYIDQQDLQSGNDREHILSEIARLDTLIALNQQKLNNPAFTAKAPPKVVEGAKNLLKENIEKKKALEKLLKTHN